MPQIRIEIDDSTLQPQQVHALVSSTYTTLATKLTAEQAREKWIVRVSRRDRFEERRERASGVGAGT